MSSVVPLEIQLEIIKSVPVISLFRFRSVSKSWKSFIDRSEFIAAYRSHLRTPNLLIKYDIEYPMQVKYVAFVDDDTFPQQKLTLKVPSLVLQLNRPTIIGNSDGLICLFGYVLSKKTRRIVIWNLSIRKSIGVALPNTMSQYVVGFGVCPKTRDLKLVKVERSGLEDIGSTSPLQVEVFSMSLGEWRILSSKLLPRKAIEFRWSQVVIGQFIYWLAIEWISMKTNDDDEDEEEEDEFVHRNLIMSFDMCTEEFKEIELPDWLIDMSVLNLSIFKLGESLVVVEHDTDWVEKQVCNMWMMRDDESKTFTKLSTYKVPSSHGWIIGFRSSGEPIVEMTKDVLSKFKIAVYETCSEHFNDLGIYGCSCGSSVNNIYNESLLLLDYDDGYIVECGDVKT